jgi:hypothetical protein
VVEDVPAPQTGDYGFRFCSIQRLQTRDCPEFMHRGPRLCAGEPLWVQTVPSSAVSLSAAMPSWGPGPQLPKDIPDHALVIGNPARQIGWMCKCGERLGDDLVCPVCGVAYQESEKGLEPKLSAS